MSEIVTLYDIAARLGAKGDLAAQKVVELQSQTNDIWRALPIKEANDGSSEKAVIRHALPKVAWRIINRGSVPSKSASNQVSFGCGGVEALADVDERLMKLNKGSNVWRQNENFAHQEAMSQEMSQTIFYGDEKINPAGFSGLGAYYYSKEKQDKIYADQIIDAGGTGDNLTSLWIVTMGYDTVYGIHPEGVPAGYKYEDKGLVEMRDNDGGIYYGYRSKYNWDMGLAVRDPRYVVRLANIDTTKFDNVEFARKMIEAYNQIHNPDHGPTYIFCNRKVQTYLSIMASEKNNVNLRFDEWAGKKVTHFWTSPILLNDAILNTETQIV
jgi:hypothetical protein